MSVDYIGTGNDDGVNMGRSDDLIGFYGLTTPIVKQTMTTTMVVSATVTVGTIIIGLLEIQAALANLGIITTV